MQKIFAKRYLLWWFYSFGGLLLVTSLIIWWAVLSVAPERVFWGMVEQSLQTNGVTAEATEETAAGTLEQRVQFSLGALNMAQSHTTITQGGNKVSTEVIGTKDTDYTRYVSVESERRDEQGQPLDFSNIIGVWATSEGSGMSGQLLGQALLGLSTPIGAMPVPIANLGQDERQKLLDYIRDQDVYETDFSKAKTETVDGRKLITYDVKIQTIAYVALMKQFAQAAGLHELDALDPNSYQGAEPMELQFIVDARSKHLVRVIIPSTGFSQRFSGYDIPVTAEIPTETVSTDEIQRRIDTLR